MTIRTDPPNSLIDLNGQEVGRAPLTRDFTWYGTYYVTVRHDGCETLKTTQTISPPIYQIIPLDLVTAILPFWFVDHRNYTYTLSPSADAGGVPGPGLMTRAEAMRGQLKGPATQASP